MYRGFKITRGVIQKILENKEKFKNEYETEANKIKSEIKNNLERYLIPNEMIDVEKLREEWFPTDEYDIFISHSHRDIEDIKVLVGYLVKVKRLKVFVDSFIWEYFEDLQKNLDNQYNLQSNNKTYDYRGSNWCCNNVSIILNSALQEVIDKSETIIFYNTPSSITHNYKDKDRTESPWIFSEIKTTRIIRKRIPKRIKVACENYIEKENKDIFNKSNARFSYSLENNHLTDISKKQFDKWIENDKITNSLSSYTGDSDVQKIKSGKELDNLYLIIGETNEKKR